MFLTAIRLSRISQLYECGNVMVPVYSKAVSYDFSNYCFTELKALESTLTTQQLAEAAESLQIQVSFPVIHRANSGFASNWYLHQQ